MKQKYDVVCIGDVVMDAFIALKEAKIEWDKKHEHPELEMAFADKIPYESLMVAPAVGNASNVAVGAARLGLSTAIITAIGGDHYGTEIMDRYHKEGVSTEYVKINKSKPTNYHFVLTYKAERTILIKHQEYEYYDPRKLDSNTDWIYFSSIAEHTLPFHRKVADYLEKHPNVKMGFNPGTFQLRFGAKKLREIYRHTYVLFVNREEAAYILHTKNEDIKFLFKGLHALGPEGGGDHGWSCRRVRIGWDQPIFYAAISGSKAADLAHRSGRRVLHRIFLRPRLRIVGVRRAALGADRIHARGAIVRRADGVALKIKIDCPSQKGAEKL